jgi:subtilase family serine protease
VRLAPCALAFGVALACTPLGASARPILLPRPSSPAAVPVGSTAVTVLGDRVMRGVHFVGPLRGGALEVQAVTTMRNASGLEAYANAASDPHSHYYKKFLTPQEIGDDFGTPLADYTRAVAYLRSFGLHVGMYPQREMLRVWGNEDRLERAFSTKFGVYRRGTDRIIAPMLAPHVPSDVHIDALAGAITGLHLNRTRAIPGGPPSSLTSGRITGFSPYQLATAFDYTGAYNAGYTGKGITIGVIGTGPVSNLEVAKYLSIFNVKSAGSFTIVPGVPNTAAGDSTGDLAAPPPTSTAFNPCSQPSSGTDYNVCNPEDLEAQLDAEGQMSLAPDANVRFYLAYNPNETTCETMPIPIEGVTVPPACTSALGTSPEEGLSLYEDELQAAISDNKADALSISFGGCEALAIATGNPTATGSGFDHNEYTSLVAEGTPIFVASGDSGPEECEGTDAPDASTPNDDPEVVSVGSTTTPIDINGRLTGPITVWGVQTETGGATGVTPSTIYATPPYQTSAGLGTYCTMRCQPDVVLNGDPATGQSVLEYISATNNAELPIGGTSASAPDMAAMWALVLQACKQTAGCGTGGTNGGGAASPAYRLGNANYALYGLYTDKTKYQEAFYDITYGESAVPLGSQAAAVAGESVPYSAGLDPGAQSAAPGFDNATGLGAPFARGLIKAIVGV